MSGMSVWNKTIGNLRRPVRILAAALSLLAVIAGGTAAAGIYREDVNGDGVMNVMDVVALLVIGRTNPGDQRADFNGDGSWSAGDATSLLNNIRHGIMTPVTGAAAPNIAVFIDSLWFENVEIGTGISLYMDVANYGDTTLVVNSISTGDPAYTVDPSSVTLAPGDSVQLEVTFTPTATGEVRSVLSLLSNDPDTDSLGIGLSGTGIVTIANKTHVITMPGLVFSPDTLTIAVGDTVRWDNTDTMAHTTTSGANATKDGIWDSGNMNPGTSFTYVFTRTGDFPYYCLYHIGARMFGFIKVE